MKINKLSMFVTLAIAASMIFSAGSTAFAQKNNTLSRQANSSNSKGTDDDTSQPRQVDPRNGIVVDDDSRCPGTAFTTIQAAVAAASPGTTIQVCPGVYKEQVVVNKRLTIVGVEYQDENQAIIQPSPAAPNSSSLFNGSPIAAVVLVNQTNNVVLDNLTVDGANGNINGCNNSAFVGVFFRNASGSAENLAVKNIRAVGDGSCQGNIGIFAQSGNGGRSRVTVLNSSVHDYEKAGIVGNEDGTELTLNGNSVSGLGPINTNVQNGIQIGFGAKGYVTSNTVLNHISSTCTTTQNCVADAGANIIVVQSNQAQIYYNTVGKSQANIFVLGNRAEVIGNNVTDTDVNDAITILGNRNEVSSNRIFNTDRAGVLVSGNQNRVRSNTINEALFGVLQDSTSSANNDLTDNRYSNTGKQNADASNTGALARESSQSAITNVTRP